MLVLDASDGLTAQDAHVAGYALEEGIGLVVAINKWDLVEKDAAARSTSTWRASAREAPFLDFAPIVADQRQDRPARRARPRGGARDRRRAPPARPDRRAQRVAARRHLPPAGTTGEGQAAALLLRHPGAIEPPTFVLFANGADAVHFSYRRYLENRLREAFGFAGTPLRLIFRERSQVELEPRRRTPHASSGHAQARQGASSVAARPRKAPQDARQAMSAADAADRHARTAPIAVVGAGAWGTTLAAPPAPARAGRRCFARDEEQAERAGRRRARTRATCPTSTIPVEVESPPIRRRSPTPTTSWSSPCRPRPCARRRARVARARRRPTPCCCPWPRASSTSTLDAHDPGAGSRRCPAAGGRIAAMSGPNLALEIARGLPASSVVARRGRDVSARVVELIGTRDVPALPQPRRDRRRAVRRAQEHHRHCRGRRRASASATTARPASSRAAWPRSRAWASPPAPTR